MSSFVPGDGGVPAEVFPESRWKAPIPYLHQFRISHYNEKVRWALDFKGIPYRTCSYLPGPHRLLLGLLCGRTLVPTLQWGANFLGESAAILERLEQIVPEPFLFSDDPEVKQLVHWFDQVLAPAVRLAVFHELLSHDIGYLGRLFCHGKGRLKTELYLRLLPFLERTMRADMAIGPGTAEQARATVEQGLDRVANRRGYLVGEQFTAADLSAAALLFPVAIPAEFPYPYPRPISEVMERWLQQWDSHPGTQWVRRIYSRHRGRHLGREASPWHAWKAKTGFGARP